MIELSAQVPLHELEPPSERGTWVVVVSVPFHPVALRHAARLRPPVWTSIDGRSPCPGCAVWERGNSSGLPPVIERLRIVQNDRRSSHPRRPVCAPSRRDALSAGGEREFGSSVERSQSADIGLYNSPAELYNSSRGHHERQ